jgi:hypothetical protein
VYALKETPRTQGAIRRTPLYVVCSPRARVGKTLIARLLVDFFRLESRPVAAFDLNSNEPRLADYLPDCATVANVGETRGQMALFDALIVNDGIAKVVDVGYGAFESFFALIQEIGFPAEARRRYIQPVILFVMDADRSSARAFADLQRRFPDLPLIALHNEGMMSAYRIGEKRPAAAPLRIPPLPPVLKSVIDKPNFSFMGFRGKSAETPSLLHAWLRQVFLQFRELELRLLLKELSSRMRA